MSGGPKQEVQDNLADESWWMKLGHWDVHHGGSEPHMDELFHKAGS